MLTRPARQAEELQSEGIFAFERDKARQEALHAAATARLESEVERLLAEREQAQLRISAAGQSIAQLTIAKVPAGPATPARHPACRPASIGLLRLRLRAGPGAAFAALMRRELPTRRRAGAGAGAAGGGGAGAGGAGGAARG